MLSVSTLQQTSRITCLQVFGGCLFAAEGSRLVCREIRGLSRYDKDAPFMNVFNNFIEISYFKFQWINKAKEVALLFVGSRFGGKLYTAKPITLDKCDALRRHPFQYNLLYRSEGVTVDGWILAVQFIHPEGFEIRVPIASKNEGGLAGAEAQKRLGPYQMLSGFETTALLPKYSSSPCLGPGLMMIAVTNQNEAVIWKLQNDKLVRASVISFNRISIVAADIVGNSLEELVISTGTSLSEVFLWKISDEQASILGKFEPHEGEITSLHFYPDEAILLSTSDDRTVVALKFMSQIDPELSPLESLRHGGATFATLIRKHTPKSKIQNALIIDGKLLTFGKDGVVKMWTTGGEYIRKFDVHGGSAIWVYAVDEDSKTIYTGSENGSLAALKPVPLKVSTAVTDVKCSSRASTEQDDADYPVSLVAYDANRFFLITNKGSLISLTITPFKELKLVSNCPCKMTMCLSGDKKILAYAYKDIVVLMDVADTEGPHLVVGEVSRCTMKSSPSVDKLIPLGQSSILVSGRKSFNRISWFEPYVPPSLRDGKRHYQLHFCPFLWQWIVPESTTHHITAGDVVMEITEGQEEMFCVLGDKDGYVYGFEFRLKDPVPVNFTRLERFGGKHAVVFIKALDDYVVLVLTRDGFLSRLKYVEDGHELIHLRRERLPFAFPGKVSTYNDLTIVMGFRSTKAVFYALETSTKILELECGGVHRGWDLLDDNTKLPLTFAYIEKKQVRMYSMKPGQDFTICRLGTHVGTINCGVTTSTFKTFKEIFKNESTLIATAGEGNSIVLTDLHCCPTEDGDEYTLQKIAEFGHMRGSVRCLFFIEDKPNSRYLLSGGGRSELMVFKIMKDDSSFLADVQTDCCINVTRVTKRRTAESKSTNSRKEDKEGDVRILGICGYSTINSQNEVNSDESNGKPKRPDYAAQIIPQHILTIFAACSDGKVRVFNTNTKNQHELMYYCTLVYDEVEGCAVTRIFSKHFGKKSKEELVFAVTSNGYLLVWRVSIDPFGTPPDNSEVMPILKYRVFECAITAMEVFPVPQASAAELSLVLIVAIGGDNGGLHVYNVSISSSNLKVAVTLRWSNNTDHRGTIMCIKKDIRQADVFYVASTDGVLTAFTVSGARLMKSTSPITDCQCLVSADQGRVLFCCGNGISALRVTENITDVD